MTLIASIGYEGNFIGCLSDILLSAPTRPERDRIKHPFKASDHPLHAGEWSVVSLRQKMIVSNNTLVLWAGRQVTSEHAVRAIFRASPDGRERIDIDLAMKREGITLGDFERSSLIYHHLAKEGDIFRRCIGCSQDQVGDLDVMGAGTGFYDFFQDIVIEPPAILEGDLPLVLQAILARIAFLMATEGLADDSLANLYGGWLEFAAIERETFRKATYGIKFWKKDDDGLHLDLPLFYSSYSGNLLRVIGYFPSSSEEKSKIEVYDVSSCVTYSGFPVTEPEELSFQPDFMFHVIFGEDGLNKIIIKKDRVKGERHFEFRPATDQSQMLFARSFLEEMESIAGMGFAASNVSWRRSDPSNY